MEKLIVGKKFMIGKELEPLRGSFKEANIEWKKKYEKYLGQRAIVLSLYGDDSVMLKFENGKVFRFPRRCVSRSEINRDEIRREIRRNSRRSFEVLDDDDFFNKINSSASPDDIQKQERHEDQSSKDFGCTAITQPISSKDDAMKTKDFGQMYKVLEELNLQDYHSKLAEDGFESSEDLENANFGDLIALGMKRGHARRLLKAMNEYGANPSDNFWPRRRVLAKRASCCSWSSSTTSSLGSSQSSNISRSPIPEPNSFEDFLSLYDRGVSDSPRLSSSTSSLSECQSSTISAEGGHLIIPFTKRPLGFGIMSPLCVGAMVSSIFDEELKGKRLCLGLPLLKINEYWVSMCNVKEIATILSRVNVPLTVTFGLNPYFEPGQRLTVMRNNKWYACTVEDMSNSKVTVRYEDDSLGLNNIEKISDYNRIKQYAKPVLALSQQVSPYNLSDVPYSRWGFHREARSNSSDNNRCDEFQNCFGITVGDYANTQQSTCRNDPEQPELEKCRSQHLRNSLKKMNKIIPRANSRESLHIITSNGYKSEMI